MSVSLLSFFRSGDSSGPLATSGGAVYPQWWMVAFPSLVCLVLTGMVLLFWKQSLLGRVAVREANRTAGILQRRLRESDARLASFILDRSDSSLELQARRLNTSDVPYGSLFPVAAASETTIKTSPGGSAENIYDRVAPDIPDHGSPHLPPAGTAACLRLYNRESRM